MNAVEITPHGVLVPLPGRSPAYFNAYWLRDNCPTSFDHKTRERTYDIFHLTQPPRPATAQIEGDALVIAWSGEPHVSRYPLAWLASYAEPGPRPDPADLPRRAWFADHYPAIARFALAELVSDKQARAEWLKAMLVEGIAIVTDMPDTDQSLEDLVGLIGHVRPTFFGRFFNVQTHIAPTNLAYTAGPLELHTDTPAEDMAPGIQFLHCRANTVEGGESLFLDGVAVANAFRETHPKAFRLLVENAIPFYCEHDTYDMRARQSVIELDRHGAVSGLTISQHMADMCDLPQTLLDDYYPAFCAFGQSLQDPRFVMRFLMKAGECIVFDNHRIVHGRAGYCATSGDRRLRGCYADRGEMRSTYRTLVGKGRFQ